MPPSETVIITWSCTGNVSSASRSWTSENTPHSGSSSVEVSAPGVSNWTITCTGPGGSTHKRTATVALERIVLSGKVTWTNLLPGEAPPVTRLYVSRKGSADTDSVNVAVNAAGSGSFSIFTRWVKGECVELRLDEFALVRTYFPQYVEKVCEPDNNASFVRSPLRLRITEGKFAGQSAPVPLDIAAYSAEGNIPSNGWLAFLWRFLGTGGVWGYIGTWKEPAPYAFAPSGLVFHNPGGLGTTDRGFDFTAEDSLRYIATLEEMNWEVGLTLTRHVSWQEIKYSCCDTFGNPRWSGIPVILWGEGNRGLALWGNDHDIVRGAVWHSRGGAQERVARIGKHEILHALGFGHTMRRTSVMSMVSSTQDPWDGQLSLEDVAYIRLIYEAREAQRATNSKYWLPESHQGERKFILSLPAETVHYGQSSIGFGSPSDNLVAPLLRVGESVVIQCSP